MLIGANAHPWADWTNSLTNAARVKGGLLRWDEYTATSKPEMVVTHIDQVLTLGLVPVCIIVSPSGNHDPNVFAAYLQQLVPLNGRRKWICEVGNEPNYQGWPAVTYRQALANAWNVSGPIHISMGGLAMNDPTYLAALGPGIANYMDYASIHPYTAGGDQPGGLKFVGPCLPDDPDDAHGGVYSMVRGIRTVQQAIARPLILGEWGWDARYLTDAMGRPAWNQAAINLAHSLHVYGMCIEELGSGDGVSADQTGPSWDACVQAAGSL